MRKTFQYNATRSATAAQLATQRLALYGELYNAALQERRDAYRLHGVAIPQAVQSKQLPAIKAIRPDVAQVGSQVLQDVLQRLDRAFQAFFRRVQAGETPGYPRFRSARRYDSLTFKQAGWKLGPISASGKKRALTRHGNGTLRLFWSREMEGRVKTVTLKRDRCGDWWVGFSCDEVLAQLLPATGRAVGLDVGLEAFGTTSEGDRIAHPRPLRVASAGLRQAQRVVAKRKKGGQRRRQAVRRLAKRHRRVGRIRRDFHQQTARALVQRHDVLVVEDLNVRGLSRGRLARSVADAGWAQFLAILTDQAASAGRPLIAVNPCGTSQQCSACGAIPETPTGLGDRRHTCPCGYGAPRDVNAARNILRRGLATITGRAGPSASGRASKAAA